MKAKIGRLFLGVLMIAAVCWSAPALHVSAEKAEEDSFVERQQHIKVKEFQKEAEISKENVYFEFYDFAEFKAIIESFDTESVGTESVWAYYMGEDSFIIEEDIIFPDYLCADFEGAEVIIPANVKLSALTGNNGLYFDSLIVKGTLELYDAYLIVDEKLDIQGKILHGGRIYLEGDMIINGMENIEYTTEYSGIMWTYYVDNTAELKAVVDKANKTINDSRIEYDLNFGKENDSDAQGVINESVTIPKNVSWLDIEMSTTLAEGCTLEVDTDLYIYQPLIVKGTLINKRYTSISEKSSSAYDDGKLCIENGGICSGRGTIDIFCDEDVDYTIAVPGLNLENYVAKEYRSEYSHWWELKHIDGNNVFADVSSREWYYPYVLAAWQNGLMSGVGTTEDDLVVFAPEKLMTRAMFVQVLYGIEGKPEVAYSTKFSDVADGQWYTSAVLWASENGITSGVSATSFGVNQNITREQMALMLMKYAQLIDADVSGRANMDEFVDWESVSSWAKDAMQWAVENGVMSGEAGGKLNPQGKANRAVGATMFNAFFEEFIQ